MKIQTVNYPEAVTIWADASTFVVSISGMTGRNVRVVDANISTDASFDNVMVRMEAGFSGTPTIYLQNGTGRSGRTFDPATSADVEVHVTSLMKPQTGSFELTLEVETGVATDDFVPLAESGLDYSVAIVGEPNIEEVGGPTPPEVCFWTDLVRVTQVCEPGEDPPPPAGGNFQITTTGAEWPHINSGGNADPARLLIDFSGCADAALPMRVHVPSFAATNVFGFAFCSGYYGGGGTWIGGGPDASNAAPNTGAAFSEWAPTPFTTDVSPDTLPLFYFEAYQAVYTAPIGLAFDLLFEVYDDGAWRPMDGTGAQITLISFFPLAAISEDPVADGYLEITY